MSGKPARMASLASRFVGAAGGVHVVDPCPDLRHVFQQPEVLEQNLHLRLRPSSNIQKLREDYGRWWQSYESFLKGEAPKSELRNGVKAFLEALALPSELDAQNTSVDGSFTEMHTRAAEATESSLRSVLHLSPPGFSGRSVPALRLLQSELLSLFSSSQLISPPNFCRAALIEAVNWNPEEYLTFSSGDSSSHKDTLFLMGVSLPSLLAPFIRARFTKTNIFPITLHAAGVSYHNSPPDSLLAGRERRKHSMVAFCRNGEESLAWASSASAVLREFLLRKHGLETTERRVPAPSLSASERGAISIHLEGGLIISRFSFFGQYLSRRLNISMEDTQELVDVAYMETDICALLGALCSAASPSASHP